MPSAERLCLKFPLTSIEDDGSYRAALEILDCLFALDDLRTAAELEYFRTLARLASEYEMKHNTRNSAPSPQSLG
jgi:antitoxin component HigA of HigAB toxin-antitoxin module